MTREADAKLGAKLFTDSRVWAGDVHVETECAREGIRDRHVIDARKAALRSRDAALLAESDEAALPVAAYQALLVAKPVVLGPELAARNRALLELTTQKVYAPIATVMARVVEVDADLKANRPVLSARLKDVGGSSVPVVRPMLLAAGDKKAGGA